MWDRLPDAEYIFSYACSGYHYDLINNLKKPIFSSLPQSLTGFLKNVNMIWGGRYNKKTLFIEAEQKLDLMIKKQALIYFNRCYWGKYR